MQSNYCSPTCTSKLLFILDMSEQMQISFILLSGYHLQQNWFVKHSGTRESRGTRGWGMHHGNPAGRSKSLCVREMPMTASGRTFRGHVSEGLWGHFRIPERIFCLAAKVGRGVLKRAMASWPLWKWRLSAYSVPSTVFKYCLMICYFSRHEPDSLSEITQVAEPEPCTISCIHSAISSCSLYSPCSGTGAETERQGQILHNVMGEAQGNGKTGRTPLPQTSAGIGGRGVLSGGFTEKVIFS